MSIRRRLADSGGHICPLICGKRAFKLARCGPLLFVFRSEDHGKRDNSQIVFSKWTPDGHLRHSKFVG
jgi:hypothetical protein